jgi:hypothetical protein
LRSRRSLTACSRARFAIVCGSILAAIRLLSWLDDGGRRIADPAAAFERLADAGVTLFASGPCCALGGLELHLRVLGSDLQPSPTIALWWTNRSAAVVRIDEAVPLVGVEPLTVLPLWMKHLLRCSGTGRGGATRASGTRSVVGPT